MYYYSHHIGDFNNATRHLTRIERSVYRDLLELYYETEQPLALDQAALCRKIIARSNEEVTAVEQVLNEFFTETSTGWFHNRCEEEIEAFKSTVSAKSAAGRASAEKRRQEKEEKLAKLNKETTKAQQNKNGCSTDVQHQLDGCTTDEQLTSNHEPLTNINTAPESEADIPDGSAKRKSKPTVTLKTFMENCKANGESVIADYQPLLTYAGSVNLPEEMLVLCWEEFKVRYLPDGPSATKRYKDWRIVFLTAVKENWLKIWWVEPDGTFSLTTRGKQAEMAHREAA